MNERRTQAVEEQSDRSEHDTSGAEPRAMLRLNRGGSCPHERRKPVQEVRRDLPTRAAEELLQGVLWVGDLPAPATEEPRQGVLRVLDMPTRMGEEPLEGVRWMPARLHLKATLFTETSGGRGTARNVRLRLRLEHADLPEL